MLKKIIDKVIARKCMQLTCETPVFWDPADPLTIPRLTFWVAEQRKIGLRPHFFFFVKGFLYFPILIPVLSYSCILKDAAIKKKQKHSH